MKIIKDKQIIDDSWTHTADGDSLPSGKTTVSLARWKDENIALNDNIGIRLSPADHVDDIAGNLDKLSLIALDFPAFTDGRGFSHARLLRSRYGFTGEIRAIGSYMADQVFYLSRVGVNAFQFDDIKQLDTALSTIGDFTVKYQNSTD